ncbi:MAG: hypothetical protein IPI78_07605 [Chitinophagaceae bacterium]|nr:hypothetical protein [Chitinophagaceae bacterium]
MKHILIILLSLTTLSTFSQSITGKVNENNEPIPAATITIKSTGKKQSPTTMESSPFLTPY